MYEYILWFNDNELGLSQTDIYVISADVLTNDRQIIPTNVEEVAMLTPKDKTKKLSPQSN